MFKKLWIFPLVLSMAILSLSGVSQAAKVKADSREVAQEKLDEAALMHIARANKTLRPNREHVEVIKVGEVYKARFQEVDRATLKTEVHDCKNKKNTKYIGHIIYIENTFEALGKTKTEAMSGNFKQVKSRRMRELVRFDSRGKWVF